MDELTTNPFPVSSFLFLCIVLGYFAMLVAVGWWVGRKDTSNAAFFTGQRQSPWYVVAFGMIGASLSGVTFISVPGAVGNGDQFAYFQMVLGYLVGYAVIGLVLMPLYYRLNLTTIYTYLQQRLGVASYKTGSAFFLLSRTIGSSFRLYIVALVMHQFIFLPMGVPFWLTVFVTILLIWLYTFQGGIKTIVWTDTLQTFFMLLSVVLTIFIISRDLNLSLGGIWTSIEEGGMGQVFFFDNGWSDSKNFFKQFLGGAFIAIVMTGLDQDMMQKNLTCRSIGDAQKNMLWFSLTLVVVNFLFLVMGALLALYATSVGETAKGDQLFPALAFHHFPFSVAVVFLIGLVAAAYSSADSALAALTTAFCVDFLGMQPKGAPAHRDVTTNADLLDDDVHHAEVEADPNEQRDRRRRTLVHIGFSFLTFLVILIFYWINDSSVLKAVFTAAGYTYGPLLGLFSFSLLTRWQVRDALVPFVCVAAPILTYVLNANSQAWLGGYKFGFELLLVNAGLTFVGLVAVKK